MYNFKQKLQAMLKNILELEGITILDNNQKRNTKGGDFKNEFITCKTTRVEFTSAWNFTEYSTCVSTSGNKFDVVKHF